MGAGSRWTEICPFGVTQFEASHGMTMDNNCWVISQRKCRRADNVVDAVSQGLRVSQRWSNTVAAGCCFVFKKRHRRKRILFLRIDDQVAWTTDLKLTPNSVAYLLNWHILVSTCALRCCIRAPVAEFWWRRADQTLVFLPDTHRFPITFLGICFISVWHFSPSQTSLQAREIAHVPYHICL